MDAAAKQSLFFSGFEFRTNSEELLRDGQSLGLQPTPAAILRMLIERPGELVTREEIIKRIWPNTTVDFDQRISSSIKQIRNALNDDSKAPSFIKTAPRQGYRFIAELTAAASPPGEPADDTMDLRPSPAIWRRFMPAALFPVIAVIAFAATSVLAPKASDVADAKAQEAATVLLILPTIATDDYDKKLAKAITNQIMLRFSADQPQSVELVAGDAAAGFADVPNLARRASRELGADHIMRSVIERNNGHRTIVTRFVSTENQTLLWSQSFDLPFIERRAASEAAATQIVEALNQQLLSR